MQTDYTIYSASIPIDKRISTLSLSSKQHDGTEYAINRFSQKYDSYQEFLYRNNQQRRWVDSDIFRATISVLVLSQKLHYQYVVEQSVTSSTTHCLVHDEAEYLMDMSSVLTVL